MYLFFIPIASVNYFFGLESLKYPASRSPLIQEDQGRELNSFSDNINRS